MKFTLPISTIKRPFAGGGGRKEYTCKFSVSLTCLLLGVLRWFLSSYRFRSRSELNLCPCFVRHPFPYFSRLSWFCVSRASPWLEFQDAISLLSLCRKKKEQHRIKFPSSFSLRLTWSHPHRASPPRDLYVLPWPSPSTVILLTCSPHIGRETWTSSPISLGSFFMSSRKNILAEFADCSW